MSSNPYPIGTPGQPWGASEKSAWLASQRIQRSYADEVERHILALQDTFNLEQYGQLVYSDGDYALWGLRSKNWQPELPTALVTGGVHGYETSGVQGALRFAQRHAADYLGKVNLLIAPCISPWGYETINRWNPDAIDPNRSFYVGSKAGESVALMHWLRKMDVAVTMHIDLHETTDTDNSEFRPALAARDGKTHDNWNIPDGFYLVGDTFSPMPQFQRAVLDAVQDVTHIAEADENNQLIGSPLVQFGVVNYDTKKLGLCAGVTDALYVTTTEVYPDSPKATPEQCIQAQVAAIRGALGYVLKLKA
ncbi:M14 family metallocarboxypeptidase [Bowmanella yangjiangensis]|uniref:M14 family metallocarboxypeptidase n=1 Tax=Bowmanella yangjiangensis TaxID=2811230 RepID=A0ABS3CYC4_9ALTE|nr:M14 family metallocarboxypeptidase [Bowmanella yangjiangensis]MBN7822128.1 M14 family metallocarboxypeptidase [Bowmanella yangjiangensis]